MIDDDRPDFDDGSEGNYEQERSAMLAAFEKQLADDPRLLRYDEEEWIMLADYASDIDNFYLFSEAVMRGLIAYPDSADLSDRRLLLLNDICRPEELRKVFNAAASAPTATKIARLYQAYYQWEDRKDEPSTLEAYKSIRSVALDSERLTDQETIETVRILADMGALKLLADDIQLWSSEIEFPETLWYELSVTAYEQSMYDIAADVVELLVNAFPYNQKYWLLKGRIHYLKAIHTVNDDKAREAEFEEAGDAVETARAIDPDDEEAIEFRKHIDLFKLQQDASESDLRRERMTLFDQNGNPLSAEDFLKTTNRATVLLDMSPELLIFFLDDGGKAAIDIVCDWIRFECASLEKHFDFDFDNYRPPRFYAMVESLYIMDRGDNVDFILDKARGLCSDSADYEPLLMLELIRTVEHGNFIEADRTIARMSKVYEAQPDVNFDIMRSIVDRQLGRTQRADEGYSRYRVGVFNGSTNLYGNLMAGSRNGDESQIAVNAISPVVAHFMIRRATNITDGGRQ